MPNGHGQDDSIEDVASINKNAENARERKAALDWCLANRWVREDIAKLERLDTDQWHGWLMWRHS